MINQQAKTIVKCNWCETPKHSKSQVCSKCRKVPGDQLNDPPFGNKIVRRGKDQEGYLTAMDSEGNFYCWNPEDEMYVWGLTIPQLVKMDGMGDLEEWEKEEYRRWRSEHANDVRRQKRLKEDATMQGIKNRKYP